MARLAKSAVPSPPVKTVVELKLPKGWRMVRFDELAQMVTERVDPSETDAEIYVGLEHLDSDSLALRRWGTPSDVIGDKLRFQKGDIIFGRRRAYQRKLAVAEFDGICSAHAMVVRAKVETIDPEFLPFLMQSDLFMQRAIDISVGSLSPTINWKTLRIQEFPLPPKDEQRRIANILWLADETVVAFTAAVSHADQCCRIVIADEIRKTHRFSTRRMIDLINVERPLCYGIVQPGIFDPDGVPFVRVCDMEGGEIAVDKLERVSKSVSEQYRRSIIRAGDVLLSIVGTIGRVAKVPAQAEGFNIARAVARIAPGTDLLEDYLIVVLRSEQFQRTLVGESVETARKTLNLGAIEEMMIPVPPIEEQKEIVARVEAAERSYDLLRSHASLLRHTSNVLRNTLLRARPYADVH